MTIKGSLAVTVQPSASIDAALRLMAKEARRVRYAGVAVVIDDQERVVGIVTDGDIRRAYAADVPFTEPVARVMSADPVTVPAALPLEAVPAEIRRRIRKGGRLKADMVRHVLVTDTDGRLVGIHDSLSLFAYADPRRQSIAIHGMGFVGLALAAGLSNRGHSVVGIDADPARIASLRKAEPPVLEPGLAEGIAAGLAANALRFAGPDDAEVESQVHIVAADTVIDAAGAVDLAPVLLVSRRIGTKLRPGSMVMVCSTVPAGATRGPLRRALEEASGLRAGEDFALAFTPERIQQGNAIAELRNLPQIVGGFSQRCAAQAAAFWSTLTPYVVKVEGLEAAELIKLANNAFRDLSIAFANEVALIADQHNLDAFALIRAANQGYPRNPIPLPSPGAGGAGLSRDAHMMGLSLGAAGRRLNEKAAVYPAEVVARFARRRGVPPSELTVVILGLAFKGEPETNSLIGSPSLSAARAVADLGARVTVWDAVIPAANLRAAGLEPVASLPEALAASDAVLILNNHRRNVAWKIEPRDAARPRLIFDGWSMLDRAQVESIRGHVYATMGYMTAEKFAVIACDNGLGHVRRCAAIAGALRDRGARCDLFVPAEAGARFDSPTIDFSTHSTAAGWRAGARETVAWPERLPNLDSYDRILADSLPEILDSRSDAILIGHFLWTHTLPDADKKHAAHVEALLRRHRPRMLGTALLASDRLKAATRYEDVGFFAHSELDLVEPARDGLLVSSGLGAEPVALTPLREVVARLASQAGPPRGFARVHVEPGLMPDGAPRWMVPASYEPSMYREIAAAIVRPGAGTVTDCLARAVWLVWPRADADHQEIVRNAEALAAEDLGAIAATPADAIELVCDFVADPARVAALRERCRSLPFDGAARAATALMTSGRSAMMNAHAG